MMLVEETAVPTESLPVTEFKDHLRLGTGFSDDAVQDIVLESYVRSAISAIEARTGKALIQRGFVWTVTRWRDAARQTLPIAPVANLAELKLLDAAGEETVVDASRYALLPDGQCPCLVARGGQLPAIPQHGTAEVRFTAGYAEFWPDAPPDLIQAIFLLAAHYYENRSAMSQDETLMPFGVSLLIDRYRRVRLFGEAAR